MCVCVQEVAKLRKEVQISKAALEASQAAAKKADADLAVASAAAEAGTAGKTAADKVCSICCIVASVRGFGVVLVGGKHWRRENPNPCSCLLP